MGPPTLILARPRSPTCIETGQPLTSERVKMLNRSMNDATIARTQADTCCAIVNADWCE